VASTVAAATMPKQVRTGKTRLIQREPPE